MSDAPGARDPEVASAPSARRRWWEEPLLHFALLGATLFLVEGWLVPRDALRDPERPIVVSSELVRGLETEELRRTGRALAPDAREAAIARFVQDEALYREALALALDEGDPIVRRRLIQKMHFVLEGAAALPMPDDATLEAFLEENAERYRLPARTSFTHVFFSRDRRGEATRDDARRALEAMSAEEPAPAGASERGDPFLLQYEFRRKDRGEVARVFGLPFANALESLPEGRWGGPVPSAYGEHLVRVTERVPSRLPALAEAREAVLRDWEAATREREVARAVADIVGRYRVDRRDRAEGPAP